MWSHRCSVLRHLTNKNARGMNSIVLEMLNIDGGELYDRATETIQIAMITVQNQPTWLRFAELAVVQKAGT